MCPEQSLKRSHGFDWIVETFPFLLGHTLSGVRIGQVILSRRRTPLEVHVPRYIKTSPYLRGEMCGGRICGSGLLNEFRFAVGPLGFSYRDTLQM
jgi:hypothetical protein